MGTAPVGGGASRSHLYDDGSVANSAGIGILAGDAIGSGALSSVRAGGSIFISRVPTFSRANDESGTGIGNVKKPGAVS